MAIILWSPPDKIKESHMSLLPLLPLFSYSPTPTVRPVPLFALLPLLPLLPLLHLRPCPPSPPAQTEHLGLAVSNDISVFVPLASSTITDYDNFISLLGNTTSIPLIHIVFSCLLQTVELQVAKSSSASLIWIIAVLSILLAICFVVSVAFSSVGRRLLKISKPRKMTTQSITSTEMVTIEDVDSPGPVSRTENVTRDNDEVFPYDVIQTWTGSNGPYMSLNRTENNNFHHQVVEPQVRIPDYTNISPSNRNDSAANCMYAPLRLSTVVAGSNTGRRPYVNVDTSEASSDM